MKMPQPNYTTKLIFLPSFVALFILLLAVPAYASSTTNVSVTSNTGQNCVNGNCTQSTSHTYVNINGKEYVNDDSGGTHDITDDTNGGHVEVHVNGNSANSTNSVSVQGDQNVKVNNTPQPTVDIKPTIAKKNEEVKRLIAQKKAEQKQKEQSLLERIRGMFANFGSLFKVFARS